MRMPQRVQLVTAPKISNGTEQYNDVVDWHGLQFFDQSLRFRTTCPLRAAWLFLSASTPQSLCTGVHVVVLFAFVLCFLLTSSPFDEIRLHGARRALQSPAPVE
uniref:Uncharacterized protein n=1 Tax=Haptolina brevifila TaxID=156173 RepID=A0A7S2DKL1_9EUKA|mmetsp:Transcript_39856/g.79730  ORF Transcript_39856/g.79730 Transcript_39856/m.79730 type:complete len:104 (+) Transcript_39856:356-667(+)